MAKYEDYKARHDASLEQEIDEAASVTEQKQTEDNVPERFKGKSREEIAAAWAEADRTLARQGNELGTLRKTVEELVEKAKTPVTPPPAPVPVTMDDIYTDADAAVRRVVREESSTRIDDLEGKLQQAEQRARIAEARTVFEGKHPEYKTTLADPAFIEWIKASPVRVQLAVAADQGNFDVADELFSTYSELKQARTEKPSVRSKEAKAVALERSGGNTPAPVETFSRHALQEKRISAQRGDRAAAAWLLANGPAISEAYAEGRLST